MEEAQKKTKSYDEVRESGDSLFLDLGYQAFYKVYDYRIEFTVYECFETTQTLPDGNTLVEIMYQKGNDWTADPTESKVILEGYVKWDGCSNWDFHPADTGAEPDGTQHRHMKHGCTKEDLTNYGVLLGRLWDLGSKIPHWNY